MEIKTYRGHIVRWQLTNQNDKLNTYHLDIDTDGHITHLERIMIPHKLGYSFDTPGECELHVAEFRTFFYLHKNNYTFAIKKGNKTSYAGDKLLANLKMMTAADLLVFILTAPIGILGAPVIGFLPFYLAFQVCRKLLLLRKVSKYIKANEL